MDGEEVLMLKSYTFFIKIPIIYDGAFNLVLTTTVVYFSPFLYKTSNIHFYSIVCNINEFPFCSYSH